MPPLTMEDKLRRLPRIKIVVLGRSGCGKSALIVRFLTKRYIGEYDRNREMIYRDHYIGIDKEKISLEIMDSANKEKDNGCNLEAAIRWGDGFIIMYSVTDRASFETVSPLKRLIDKVKKNTDAPIIIVSNKNDLENSRQVVADEGRTIAQRMNCPFVEITVAESTSSTFEAFETVVREVLKNIHRSLSTVDRSKALRLLRHRLRRRSETM